MPYGLFCSWCHADVPEGPLATHLAAPNHLLAGRGVQSTRPHALWALLRGQFCVFILDNFLKLPSNSRLEFRQNLLSNFCPYFWGLGFLAPRANFSLPSQPRAAQSSHFPNLPIGAPSRVAVPGLFFLKKRLVQKALKKRSASGATNTN